MRRVGQDIALLIFEPLLTFQDTSPADSPQHGEENHITEHEAPALGTYFLRGEEGSK